MAGVFRIWAWEIAAMVANMACLGAMVILLATYDDHKIFSFYGLTLNTIIALLSATSKTTLLFVLSSTIGQWKWVLFSRKPRPLFDAYIIDEASRGPLGSIYMLWRLRGPLFINLGALCTVLSLATDPLSQQLIQYSDKITIETNATASVPKASRFSKGFPDSRSHVEGVEAAENITDVSVLPPEDLSDFLRYSYVTADSSVQSALYYGLIQSRKNIVQQLPVTCTSGNCTFDPYQSLAVCSRCVDLVDQITVSPDHTPLLELISRTSNGMAAQNGTRYELPNGLYIQNPDAEDVFDAFVSSPLALVSCGTGDASATLAFKDLDTLMWSMTIIRAMEDETSVKFRWPPRSVEAKECALFYCVNEYKSVIRNGVLDETVAQDTRITRNADSWQPTTLGNFREIPDNLTNTLDYSTTLRLVKRTDLSLGKGYNITWSAVQSMSGMMHTILSDVTMGPSYSAFINGYYALTCRKGANCDNAKGRFLPSIMPNFYYSKNITDTFENIAISLSNAIRSGSDDALEQPGLSQHQETRFKVQWWWICLNGILSLFGLIDLTLTTWTTCKEGVQPWKSHFLAAMAWGGQLHEPLSGTSSIRDMERVSRLQQAAVYEAIRGDGKSQYVSKQLWSGRDDQAEIRLDELADKSPHVSSRYVSEQGETTFSTAHRIERTPILR